MLGLVFVDQGKSTELCPSEVGKIVQFMLAFWVGGHGGHWVGGQGGHRADGGRDMEWKEGPAVVRGEAARGRRHKGLHAT